MRALGFAALALAAGLFGCDGVVQSTGITEPVRVAGGQFYEGDLPVGTAGPPITTVNSQNNAIPQGETGKALGGDARSDAFTIGMRLQGEGSGYWVVPVGLPDLIAPGQLSWNATCDFARDLSVGVHTMGFIAADQNGTWGPLSTLPLQVNSLVPTGDIVFSLTWDNNADLDLHVVTPSGNEIDPKHITSAATKGNNGVDPDAGMDGVGVLDHDSNGGCQIDGLREEDVVFATAPAPGHYLLRVDLFGACGQSAVHWTLNIYSQGNVVKTVQGLLLAMDADGGGSGSGLLVADLTY